MDGALAKLVTLDIDYSWHVSLSSLTTVLASGAAPLIRSFYFNATGCNEEDLDSIADMLEARALIPACPGFECIDGKKRHWFDQDATETHVRLLCTLLPPVKELPPITWIHCFEDSFIDMKPQYLTRIEVWFWIEESLSGTFPSTVLKAAPALESVVLFHRPGEETPLASGNE